MDLRLIFLKADRISHFLNPRETPPSMLYDRTDDEEMLTLPNSTTSECIAPGSVGLMLI
jgi:hypothetical protein